MLTMASNETQCHLLSVIGQILSFPARPFSFQSADIFYYLLSLDMGANQEDRLHDHNGDTHVNAHDFSTVDFAKKSQYNYN